MKVGSLTAPLLLLVPAAQGFTAPSHFQSPAPASSRHNRSTYSYSRLSLSKAPTSTSNPYTSPQLDVDALTKYSIATLTELSLFTATFASLDFVSSTLLHLNPSSLPKVLVSFLFYAISLKSRVFNPLNNERPDRSKARNEEGSNGFRDRVMPSWTPPGVVFPIMWLLIIGPIRAYSASLIISTTNTFLSLPIMAFILHLTIGDVWNTINNTEKRYGASVIGVLIVLASAVNASIQYYKVLPVAGKLLGLTCVWLSVASALITDTWRLNPVSIGDGGDMKRVPLYPVKGEAETGFLWFRNSKVELVDDGASGAGPDESVSSGPGCIRKMDSMQKENKVTYRNRAHLHKVKFGEEVK